MRAVGVLDRTKEPGSIGEPLYLDVVAALAEAHADGGRTVMPRVTGGRYGLSSKEFTPAMVAGVFAELAREQPRRRFTIGIDDDVSGTSVDYDPLFDIESPDTVRAIFFGLGSDGTVSANKNTIKILGSEDGLHAQAYFVYDSKKSGSQTESHLRFGPHPIRAPYLVTAANFVGCHQFRFLDKIDVLGRAAPGAALLLNCRLPSANVWDALPRRVQEQILDKRITLYTVDADRIAREAGLAGRINIVLQTCFFAISDVLPRERAIARIKESVEKTYGNRGADVLAKELAAVDGAVAGLQRIEVPALVTSVREPAPTVPESAPEFVRTVTAEMMAGPRKPAARQRASDGRHLPERHDGLREAQHLRSGRGLGFRQLHPVRKLRVRLPPQRDPVQVLRRVATDRRAGRVRLRAAGRRRPAQRPVLTAGLRRGLHRLRLVRRGLPGRHPRPHRQQGDQPRSRRAAGGHRAEEHRFLRVSADQ